ncbi:MAG: aminotransferase class V-fold PLP-dependent enzyme [Sedimentisphaerales bacterium]|nr:aminotransferase class V-fold PLP-dependent enzyme [Sedimentisphaerales bacterium]
MTRRIYFDNAATSFPKPACVYEAMDHYAREIGASAGRGAYREAMESGEIIGQTRRRIAQLINASDPDSVIMTFNCTDGLALAIKGFLTEPGGHVITTRMEHNSVLRPLNALKDFLDIEITYIPADTSGLVDPDDIRRAVKSNTRLICLVHASNVCGALQDIKAAGEIAQELGLAYLVDAAQTAGHLPLDVQAMHVDMLAFPGHKGLLGPLGTGALYVRPGFESRLKPLKEGGTGSRSEVPIQPDFMPDRYESGSHNALGIAGLNEGLRYILDKGIDSLRDYEEELCAVFLENTADIPGLVVYGPCDIDKRVGVFSVSVEGFDPAELAAVLEEQFGLLTRPGLHCAPFAHQAMGTFDKGGTTRFSMGPFISIQDIRYAAEALVQIACAQVK